MMTGMTRRYILDAEHRPVIERDLMRWVNWFETSSNGVVDCTEITSALHVSTIFRGINHHFTKKEPPLLFETTVFDQGESIEMHQYAFWDDAVTGHAATVRRLREKATGSDPVPKTP